MTKGDDRCGSDIGDADGNVEVRRGVRGRKTIFRGERKKRCLLGGLGKEIDEGAITGDGDGKFAIGMGSFGPRAAKVGAVARAEGVGVVGGPGVVDSRMDHRELTGPGTGCGARVANGLQREIVDLQHHVVVGTGLLQGIAPAPRAARRGDGSARARRGGSNGRRRGGHVGLHDARDRRCMLPGRRGATNDDAQHRPGPMNEMINANPSHLGSSLRGRRPVGQSRGSQARGIPESRDHLTTRITANSYGLDRIQTGRLTLCRASDDHRRRRVKDGT